MFGVAAPVIPGRGPAQGFAPPQQQGFAPPQPGQPARPQQAPQPQQPQYQAPPQQQFQPPPQQQFQPPQQQHQPPQQQQFHPPPQQQFQPPPQQQFQPPPQQQQFQPPPQQQFQPPPQQQFGQPPPQQQFGQPPPQQFGQPPPQQYGQPPPQQFGQPPPQQQFGQPPQPGYPPQQPAYPQAGPGFGVAPQHDLPGPLDDMARKLPSSAPGTIFGFQISKLRDASLQRKILFLAGIALVASIVVPTSISPLAFPFSTGNPFWAMVLFPIIAGAAYLLVAAAPPNLRQQIPPVVIQWIPFGVSFWGLMTVSLAAGAGGASVAAAAAALEHATSAADVERIVASVQPMGFGGSGLYTFAYVLLLFGLLSRIAKPSDQTARTIIVIGAGLLVLPFLSMIGPTFGFGGGIISIITSLLSFLVTILGIFCILFIAPPQKLPPALQAIDAFGPMICAILLLWPPLAAVLGLIGGLISGNIVGSLLGFARVILYLVAFLGVFLMAAPSVYESLFDEPVMRRSPLKTLLLCFVPLFGVYWLVETKNEMKKRTGMALPSGWWIAVPFGSIYFLWKWAEGVEKTTGHAKMTAFLFMMFIAPWGLWVIQGKFNQLDGGGGGQQQGYAAGGGGGYPPPGGGYPPPGGGYPPQGGGGYPPQGGGGYPPPGGGYPPPGGGGWQPPA
jgi:hypothetical protein